VVNLIMGYISVKLSGLGCASVSPEYFLIKLRGLQMFSAVK
jgi:hypothetical protein